MKPILVTCYKNPDLDGVASGTAYGEFLRRTEKEAETGFFGELQEEAKYILERFRIKAPKIITGAEDFAEVVLVDASDLHGLPNEIPPEKVMEIIDHRKVHEAEKFPNAKAQIELVGACATLIAEKFKENKIKPSVGASILLFGAIISNTLNFKGDLTTDRDRNMAEWLNQFAELPENFWREMFLAKSDLAGEKLAKMIADDFHRFGSGGKRVGIAQIEMIGARVLVKQRETEIISELEKIKNEKNLDFAFLNIIELEECHNIFVTSDAQTRELLKKVLNVKFSGNSAERKKLIMRKQIVPLLKEELEKIVS